MYNITHSRQINFINNNEDNYILIYWRYVVDDGYSIEVNVNDEISKVFSTTINGSVENESEDLAWSVYYNLIELFKQNGNKVFEILKLNYIDEVEEYLKKN
jgi:hypothetical protein